MAAHATTQRVTPAPRPGRTRAPVIQPKLRVGAVNDPAEREADHAAAAVLAGAPPPALGPAPPTPQRKCAACEADEGLMQREAASPGPPIPAPASSGLTGPGTPMPEAVRAYFEPRFGQDFAGVQIHADAAAGRAAAAIDARAFTFGEHIAFAPGNFAPTSAEGRRLLAHELAHVVQQRGGADQVIRRETHPLRNAPGKAADPLGLLPQIMPQLGKQFAVHAYTEASFQALTGIRAGSLPEKTLLPPEQAGLSDASPLPTLGAAGSSVLFAPRPVLPLPIGTTGALWSMDGHLSQFAVLPQENPALAFFFGDSSMTSYGYRSYRALHIESNIERDLGFDGGPGTAWLNRGTAPGNYRTDLIDPYIPIKGGAVAIHTQGGADALPGAQELAACMAEARRSGTLRGTYNFSTPPRKSPAFDAAWGPGTAADPNFKPPEIINCLTRANKLTNQALGGRDLDMQAQGRDASVGTGRFLDTGEPAPNLRPNQKGDLLPGHAANMRDYIAQFDTNPNARGLGLTRIDPGMGFAGLTGVLRVGGFVLMIVNLARVTDRYQGASEYDKPMVVGEEATTLTAGLLGSLIGEVIGEAVLCVGTGPAFAFCMLAVGAIGGALGSEAATDTAHQIGQTLQDAAELHRQGKLLPGILDVGTQVLGSEAQKKALQDMKKTEAPDRPSGMFDLFNF